MPLSSVIQAQRIVIRSLCKQQAGIRYVPEREQDRKVWLLELIE